MTTLRWQERPIFWFSPSCRRARRGALAVAEVPVSAYTEIGTTVRKYADRNIDFADTALVWLANHSGMRDILTVDEADFSVYRLKGGKRFALLKWFD